MDHGDDEDLVVLLDEARRPVGTAPREGVHGTDTPLHLAFSCWLLDADGRILVTRRALGKRSWPGVWTNSFCGHPRPGEALEDAVVRHGRRELGVEVADVRPLLPDFTYRAVDASGVVEHEFCPVFVARAVSTVTPAPDEVAEHHWITLDDYRASLATAPWALSPWMVEQARQIDAADLWSRVAPGEG
ncbi:isopentenyl-diphosphate Delta-isomerase [Nocardioides sp. Y6]|uniref:Isopentenyl-diphosphate Delta-isomerase n=1 Tax=Nocardioides malaquae TaxID=2773426 RepID=A0ABR9RUJ0_9ACTN|nr:isopentenyl-diphosphate Delta-isomerase [Nocardioides malaquae]MBE7325221.1 isopentenyl-diphosphate Delta-isomerase [Nocardioides malaquae]